MGQLKKHSGLERLVARVAALTKLHHKTFVATDSNRKYRILMPVGEQKQLKGKSASDGVYLRGCCT